MRRVTGVLIRPTAADEPDAHGEVAVLVKGGPPLLPGRAFVYLEGGGVVGLDAASAAAAIRVLDAHLADPTAPAPVVDTRALRDRERQGRGRES